MTPAQALECFTVGALATFTGCDDESGPTTWAAIRTDSGLAVCAETLPALSEPQAIRAWMVACPRVWVLVDAEDTGWCVAQWWYGHGDPEQPTAPIDVLCGQDGEAALLLATAACSLAAMLYPAWARYAPAAIDVEVVAVFPVRGGVEC